MYMTYIKVNIINVITLCNSKFINLIFDFKVCNYDEMFSQLSGAKILGIFVWVFFSTLRRSNCVIVIESIYIYIYTCYTYMCVYIWLYIYFNWKPNSSHQKSFAFSAKEQIRNKIRLNIIDDIYLDIQ